MDALNNGQFHVECPSCEEEVKLSESGLFHLDNFTPESRDIYKGMVDEQKERRADLKKRKLDIPKKSEVGASVSPSR